MKKFLEMTPVFFVFLFGTAGLLMVFIFVSQGDNTNPTLEVGNQVPTVDNVATATSSYGVHASNITLTENTTTSVFVYGRITDGNGCEDVATSGSARAFFYNDVFSDTCFSDGNGGGDDDRNCYSLYSTSTSRCSFGTQDSGNELTCDPGDTQVSFECEFHIHHFADATGAGASVYATSTWYALVYAIDGSDGSGFATSSPAEMEVLTAVNISSTINYGTLSLNTTSTDVGLQITNTGNEVVDVQISGSRLVCDVTGFIATTSQKYATGTVTYESKTALSSTPSTFQLNLPQQTTSNTVSTSSLNWQLQLPISGVNGTCSGTTTLTATQ